MNVFVLNTGRCGSTTFIEACKHINNYSCGHESRCNMLADDRLNYPKNHIEADNRLSWLLGRLDKKYGDNALYVHLVRNKDETTKSFVKRYNSGIIKAYRGDGILLGLNESADPYSVADDYYETVNSNIELFLKDKQRKIFINLEDIENGFKAFWEIIQAEGNLNNALKEFSVKHNASKVNASKTDKILKKLKVI